MKILVRFVHKIAPSAADVHGPLDGQHADLMDLTRARTFLLRELGFRCGRAEGRAYHDGFVVFPRNVGGIQIWHSVILSPVLWVPNESEARAATLKPTKQTKECEP